MQEDCSLIGPLLQTFFGDFLCTQKRASLQTIASYRDTFRLLLNLVEVKRRIAPAAMQVTDLDVSVILAFLDHLEHERQNSVRSRNARLAAIRTFFRVVALRNPTSVHQCSCLLAIPIKRADKQLIKSLSRDEMDAILAAHDLARWSGRRDRALLLTLYHSGARVSEIAALDKPQVCFGTTTFLRLHGKGRKERTVPLWPKTARMLKSWFDELSEIGVRLAFPSTSGTMLTRNGVNYALQQAVVRAFANCPSLRDKKITPHTLRHTTATHLLQAAVHTSVIALWLGHETTETTHVYIEADLATKERALNKLAPPTAHVPKLKVKDSVLAFLSRL